VISGIVTEGHAIVTVMFRIPNRADIPIEFVVDTGFPRSFTNRSPSPIACSV
jgi:predicted aspartyl protease